jgi:ATP/maltotriose-dependent transcriptional regulator MalT
MAKALILKGDLVDARAQLKQAEGINRKVGSPRLDMDIQNAYVEMNMKQGNMDEAGTHQDSIARIAQSIGDMILGPDLRSDPMMLNDKPKHTKGKNDGS